MKKNIGVAVLAMLTALGGAVNAADFSELSGKTAAGLKASFAAEGIAGPAVSKGFVDNVEPDMPLEWVFIPGGKFNMGTTSTGAAFRDAKPVREVAIKSFRMAKTPVTVAQYAECVAKGACAAPGAEEPCNWGKPGREEHPVNCVTWSQAQDYAKFKGARLPSEAEWEYAATSGGENRKYPWGNYEPVAELAVFNADRTMPVCSRPKGNTAQGLCDMSGNVYQWVQDLYQDSYKGAPVDGGAVEGTGSYRVLRGGSFLNDDAFSLRSDSRAVGYHSVANVFVGFRLAK